MLQVVQADLEGGDAVVHLISEVLVPGDKAAAPTPTAAPSNNKKCTHVVKEGDTLFKLGECDGVAQGEGTAGRHMQRPRGTSRHANTLDRGGHSLHLHA